MQLLMMPNINLNLNNLLYLPSGDEKAALYFKCECEEEKGNKLI
jgi:hypothetical protein